MRSVTLYSTCQYTVECLFQRSVSLIMLLHHFVVDSNDMFVYSRVNIAFFFTLFILFYYLVLKISLDVLKSSLVSVILKSNWVESKIVHV